MKVGKCFEFDAAHRLPDYKGKCANLHGHRWKFQVVIEGEVDKKTGMVKDFNELKRVVEVLVLDELDHTYLNKKIKNPTAENIATWIFNTLKKQGGLDIVKVRLWETPTSFVETTNED
uniref:6-carboxy-5,6,7,8-tetrahydropterin synthase n=1 Tax=Caldisericum exile TaxID=693075 RepID=A0A7C4XT94_9BACT